MFGRNKKRVSSARDEYSDRFSAILSSKEAEEREQKLQLERDLESMRKREEEADYNKKQKETWTKRMKIYRDIVNQIKNNPPVVRNFFETGEYDKFAKGITDPGDYKVALRAMADEAVKRDTLAEGQLAASLYSLTHHKGAFSKEEDYLTPPEKKKLLRFVDRVKDKYSSRELSIILGSYFNLPIKRTLEGKTFTFFVGLLGVVASLFFLSPLATGNVIGSIALNESSIMGILIFLLGIFSMAVSFRR